MTTPLNETPSDTEMLARARSLTEAFYWACFRDQIGTGFHSFLEFVGVMSAYLDMVSSVLEQGGELHPMNTHSQQAYEVPDHKLLYLAEKLGCIFAPFLRGAPQDVRQRFANMLIGKP